MFNFLEAAPVYSYSRAQAIADGDLVDVSEAARSAGIVYPVALTAFVWRRYIEVPTGDSAGQSRAGRLWDLLWMFRCAARRAEGDTLPLQLLVAIPESEPFLINEAAPQPATGVTSATHRVVTLRAIVGPGDTLDPVITILMPDED
ncbi:hypothetical protein NON20_23930 (plasmid) [Synechocystis sp. B12]|nr:hypothetical protein NON20_23930 [Synechocystis sp. B12]